MIRSTHLVGHSKGMVKDKQKVKTLHEGQSDEQVRHVELSLLCDSIHPHGSFIEAQSCAEAPSELSTSIQFSHAARSETSR